MPPDVRISLTTDRVSYRPGEPVGMTLRVANDSDREVTLRFSSGQRYDFAIRDDRDVEVWRWSEDRGFVQMLGEERLPGGDELVYREEFLGRLEPGTYELVGTLTSSDQAASASTRFDVER